MTEIPQPKRDVWIKALDGVCRFAEATCTSVKRFIEVYIQTSLHSSILNQELQGFDGQSEGARLSKTEN